MSAEPIEPEDSWQPPEDDAAHLRGPVPPNDNTAEQAVLGAMLISANAIADVVEVLRGRDFYRPAHETIYDAILDLYGRGQPADMVTVAQALTSTGEIGKVGGAPYLHTLASEVPVAANAGHYAQVVADAATRRRVAEAARAIEQRALSGEGEVDRLVDYAQTAMLDASPAVRGQDYAAIGDTLEASITEIETASERQGLYGLPTGFYDLDDLTGGLHPGQMVIVAARPAVGKSTLALDFCRAASIANNLTSVFFSLEMSRHDITTRMISAEAKVPLNGLRSGQVSERDWERIATAMPRIASAPLFVDDSPNLTMTEIRAKARRLKQRHDLRLIVIDYIQLMSSGKRVESRQLEVSEFSRQIKLLAKELEVPVVALSQLNRGIESRSDKRPLLSDLRESGSLEQDADIVVLLNRPDVYERESTRPGEADLIVAKHRNGPTRDVTVAFQGHYSRFVDMAPR